MVSRRSFIKSSAALGAATALSARWSESWAFYQTPSVIPLFGTALRGVGPGGIPVAAPDVVQPGWTNGLHYTLDVQQFQDQILPSSFGFPTTLWGYNPANPLGGGSQPQKHLGGIIVGKKGQAIQITVNNKLPSNPADPNNLGMHIIPNDLSIMGAMDGNFRITNHFHGGLVPWISDGGPLTWFDPNGGYGASAGVGGAIYKAINPNLQPGQGEYYYPLNQSARFGWYHDHAFGITRINAYAGIASGLIIRDDAEAGLVANAGLPPYIETSVLGGTTVRELPLVIQDKIFVGTNVALLDPTWQNVVAPIARGPGSLWYAHVYEKNRWKMAGNVNGGNAKNLVVPDPSVIPEFFGDTMLVNGTAYPTVTVEPRRYRLRFLNACNARFLNLQLYIADGSANGITLNALGNPTNAPFTSKLYSTMLTAAPEVLQIGTEGGFLNKPTRVPTNLPFNPVTMTGSLIVAPAERPDIIIDFAAMAGKDIILYNDAPAPFPMGDPRADYFPGWNIKANPTNATTAPGYGPNSRVLMRFRVANTASSTDAPLGIFDTTLMPGIDAPLVPTAATPVRQVTLNEGFDAYGRLIQMLGTTVPLASPSAGFGRAYLDPATEVVPRGTTEVWEVFNTTADVHPMHWHLVNMQVINRQPFQASSLGSTKGGVNYTGPAVAAPASENGYKETVPMYPGTVTRFITKFDLPATPFAVPPSPRTGGNEYVWHCHILEHEEHDMMRPLIVT
jgi:spore coat protein A